MDQHFPEKSQPCPGPWQLLHLPESLGGLWGAQLEAWGAPLQTLILEENILLPWANSLKPPHPNQTPAQVITMVTSKQTVTVK